MRKRWSTPKQGKNIHQKYNSYEWHVKQWFNAISLYSAHSYFWFYNKSNIFKMVIFVFTLHWWKHDMNHPKERLIITIHSQSYSHRYANIYIYIYTRIIIQVCLFKQHAEKKGNMFLYLFTELFHNYFSSPIRINCSKNTAKDKYNIEHLHYVNTLHRNRYLVRLVTYLNKYTNLVHLYRLPTIFADTNMYLGFW